MRRVNKITRELLIDSFKTEKIVNTVRLATITESNKKIKRMVEAIKIYLIAVTRGDLTIYPASDKTPNYLNLLEGSIK